MPDFHLLLSDSCGKCCIYLTQDYVRCGTPSVTSSDILVTGEQFFITFHLTTPVHSEISSCPSSVCDIV